MDGIRARRTQVKRSSMPAEGEGPHPGTNRSARVVCLSPNIPYKSVPHAGGRYLWTLQQVLEGTARFELWAPDHVHNVEALTEEGHPARARVFSQKTVRNPHLRSLLESLQSALEMGFPVLPTIGEALGILTNPELRRVIRSADVVDLQWEDYAQLAPLIRALNPRARVICTLHDVVSQRFQRYLDTRTHARGRARWILATRTARIAEKLITCTADVVIVFSDKDRRLLGSARNVEVVHPALDSFTVIDRTHDLDHREIFFVGLMSRPENIDAVEWFIDRILPEIRRREPGAHFSILGGGTPAEIVQRHSPNDAVTFHGYVEDLSPWYGRAAVCVVPLRFGAGVKFKTVEALVAGVPTVTTSVGAEGIGTASYFSALTDDPVEFADAVARVLESPTTHSERAMASRAEVSRRYSLATFSARVMSIYLDGE